MTSIAKTLHAVRDASGAIATLAASPQPGSVKIDVDHPEVVQFLDRQNAGGFSTSDAQFVRVLEDLIDTLIEKGVIRHTDLPAAAQQKLLSRKGMRHSLQGALNPLVDDHGLV